MKSYPIWIKVKTSIYKTIKSYGAKDINEESVYVGTSCKNSEFFVDRKVTRTTLANGYISFQSYHNGKLLKRLIYDEKRHEVISVEEAEIKELKNL